MYYEAISQCTRTLRNLEEWLDKAERCAAGNKFDPPLGCPLSALNGHRAMSESCRLSRAKGTRTV
jgi:hypothetical protein